MSSSQEGEEWDRDTDEVQSEASEDLYESRPNRWRGSSSAWRAITEQDRLEYTAMTKVRNQDLSIHLYNSFAVKHTQAASQGAEDAPLNQV
jgi:hypothetical protein